MKIAILTFCEANNYGAMCQAFALQKYLKNLGHDAILLKYRNRAIYIQYHMRKLSESQSFSSFLKRNINAIINFKRNIKFDKFRKKLDISKKLNYDELNEYCNNFDKIIVGSDQVWNPKNTSNDTAFLLDFINDSSKKIAFSASFANTNYFEKFGDNAFNLLRDIKFISIREQEGVEFLNNNYITSQHTLDPVLLLDKLTWKDEFAEKPICSYPYIFVYQLKPDLNLINYLNNLSREMNLKICILPYLYPCKIQSKKLKNKKILYNLSPQEFINYIYYSKVVITDSFHGTALSIVMNKDFYVSLDTKKENTNSRMVSILKTCNLSNRIIDYSKNNQIYETIDYENVEKVLNIQRQKSLSFLLDALQYEVPKDDH